MNLTSRIVVTGSSGLIGLSLVELLKVNGYKQVYTPARSDVNLTSKTFTEDYFRSVRPEYVFHVAAKVGGIKANSENPANFIYENIVIQSNVIDAASNIGVKKMIFLACSCIYPKKAKQPLTVESLFSGEPEPTNEAFAYAKIAGIKMCQAYNRQFERNFITAIPSNVFGENDSYSESSSHVISALIQKVYKAKVNNDPSITLWGSGNPLREFLYVRDLASALLFCMDSDSVPDIVNIGSGEEVSIRDLAYIIKGIFEYAGEIKFDESKPDGMMRKVLDCSVIQNLGWNPKVQLKDGLVRTIDEYLKSLC